MVNLPPLPNRTILTPAKHTVWGYTLEQMQADRTQVWEAALEEAISAIEAANAERLISIGDTTEIIRSLK